MIAAIAGISVCILVIMILLNLSRSSYDNSKGIHVSKGMNFWRGSSFQISIDPHSSKPNQWIIGISGNGLKKVNENEFNKELLERFSNLVADSSTAEVKALITVVFCLLVILMLPLYKKPFSIIKAFPWLFISIGFVYLSSTFVYQDHISSIDNQKARLVYGEIMKRET